MSPCLIDSDYNVIAGHGRLQACKEMGMRSVPCVFIEGLTEEQRKAYILADNKLTEMGEWNFEVLSDELAEIDIDMSAFGFEIGTDSDWFEEHERFDDSRQEGNDEYNEFLDKFEIPKTTDDCYTPDNIYNVVADYVSEHFGISKKKFVRPFYPNGDYQNEKYEKGAVVVDNPPFSILAEIIDFYLDNRIKFFLFCQGMLVFNYLNRSGLCSYPLALQVIYDNKAIVPTGFITNLYEDGTVIDNDPQFREELEKANKENQELLKTNLPKYEYPYDVLTPSKAGWLSKYGEHIKIKNDECALIRQLDAQKEIGAGIYGNGALLSIRKAQEREAQEREAQEREAQERAKALVFKLSDREKEIQRSLR